MPALAPAFAAVPAVAAVPTVTSVHSQRLIPQAPAVHTVARPTTVLQTVQTGNAVVGHQHTGDQVVGKTPDINGYAFKSEVRHDAPVHAIAAPIAAPAPLPVPVAAPAPLAVAAPAPVAAAPGKFLFSNHDPIMIVSLMYNKTLTKTLSIKCLFSAVYCLSKTSHLILPNLNLNH